MVRQLLLLSIVLASLSPARALAGGARAFTRPHAARASVAMAVEMIVDADADWFSTTAFIAEGLIAQPDPALEDLAQAVYALDVAVRAHQRLRQKLATRLANARMEKDPSFYLFDGLDH